MYMPSQRSIGLKIKLSEKFNQNPCHDLKSLKRTNLKNSGQAFKLLKRYLNDIFLIDPPLGKLDFLHLVDL